MMQNSEPSAGNAYESMTDEAVVERVQAGDQALMILFNRAMTQLGLAAFRAGSMVYAHNCLDDLVNVGSRNGLLRVLLGQQGSQGSQSAQSEEEMVVPAKRVVPAHMVNL